MLCAAQRLSPRPLSLSAVRSFASSNNVIFVLGAPGSGKGKHSDHLVAKFGGCHVSVGEILREVQYIACFTWQTVKTPGKYTEMIKKHMNVVIPIVVNSRRERWFLQR